VEDREPLVEGPRPEDRLELRMCIVLAREEVRPVEQLAKAAPELRLERCDGEEAAVCALVDAVTRELARERTGVARELVCAVPHRDDDVRAAAGPLAFEQRGEDARDGGQRTS